MTESGTQPLYQPRIRIYPRSVKGRFRTIKWAILGLAYGVYFLLPWLRWERNVGPDQAVLFDIVQRKFYLFGLVAHAQDLFWLAGFLMIAALLLFFVTGIAGRVFCGYFCFQTLWTDLYLLIERMVQGDRVARIRLDKSPLGANKLLRKAGTHLLWLLVAMATGLTFVFYWGDARQLARRVVAVADVPQHGHHRPQVVGRPGTGVELRQPAPGRSRWCLWCRRTRRPPPG